MSAQRRGSGPLQRTAPVRKSNTRSGSERFASSSVMSRGARGKSHKRTTPLDVLAICLFGILAGAAFYIGLLILITVLSVAAEMVAS